MTHAGAAAGLAFALAAAGLAPAARAQRVTVAGPPGDTLRDVTPSFTLSAAGATSADRPTLVTLQVAFRADFAPETLVAEVSAPGDSATVTLPTPLAHHVVIYWRARARLLSGAEVVGEVVGPRTTAAWVQLLRPDPLAGGTVDAAAPRFSWRSAPVVAPPGPWRYDLDVIAATNGRVVGRVRGTSDTSVVLAGGIEASATYRWSVTARLPGRPDSGRVQSGASFVAIDSASSPAVTALYHNFPNPFPTPQRQATCIWFDLRRGQSVRLAVYSLRGELVRQIVPDASGAGGVLAAGRYGPGAAGAGCDDRFSWDGRDGGGRDVPPGVYLLRLRADGREMVRKVMFRGR